MKSSAEKTLEEPLDSKLSRNIASIPDRGSYLFPLAPIR